MNKRCNTSLSSMIILILISVLCLNCGGKSEEVQVANNDGFQSYKLDIRGDATPFAELIEKIEITRLEETEESLLSYVRELYFFEDKMVFPSGSDGNIYVYTDKGEFIRKINRKGEGPEEYSGWNDIWLENGVLGVYNYGKSVNHYDLEGAFISRDRVYDRATHLHPYGSGYALDMNYRFTNDSLMYGLTILDGDMNVDRLLLPFDKFPGFSISTDNKTIFPVGDDLFFFRMMNDTVYRLDTDALRPYIHYDFQDDWYLQPEVELSDAAMVESEKNGQVLFMNNRIGQDYIFLNATIGTSVTNSFMIDRKSKQTTRIDKKMSADESFGISNIGWNGDEFLLTLQSPQLSSLLDQLDKEQYSFTEGTTLEEIESSENPVLIRMKIKDWQ